MSESPGGKASWRRTRKILVRTVAVLTLIGLIAAGVVLWRVATIGCGFAAKVLATEVFVAGRDPEDVRALDLAGEDGLDRLLPSLVSTEVEWRTRSVRATALFGLVEVVAADRDAGGCALIEDSRSRRVGHTAVIPTRPWVAPATPAPDLDPTALERAVADAFHEKTAPLLGTRAIVVVQDGHLVAERHGAGFDRDTRLAGWSMAKTVLGLLVGAAVHEGRVTVEEPAALAAWEGVGDARQDVTIEHLLFMVPGLAWVEDYGDPFGLPLRMLFGSRDVAGFAARVESARPPGQRWVYSSGTSNLLARALRERFDSDAHARVFPQVSLFGPLRMQTAVLETDEAGTWVASSFCSASALDWARLGQVLLQDGVADGHRLLPEGWVAYLSKPRFPEAVLAGGRTGREGFFGGHLWVNGVTDDSGKTVRAFPTLPADLVYAAGFRGQRVIVVPSRRAVIVRLGCTRTRSRFDFPAFTASILAALAE